MASVPEHTAPPGGDASPTLARLRTVVAGHLKLDADVLDRDLTLGEDLCLDSLAAAELVVAIEEDLDLTLPPSVMAGREGATYGDLEDIVCAHAAD